MRNKKIAAFNGVLRFHDFLNRINFSSKKFLVGGSSVDQ